MTKPASVPTGFEFKLLDISGGEIHNVVDELADFQVMVQEIEVAGIQVDICNSALSKKSVPCRGVKRLKKTTHMCRGEYGSHDCSEWKKYGILHDVRVEGRYQSLGRSV